MKQPNIYMMEMTLSRADLEFNVARLSVEHMNFL